GFACPGGNGWVLKSSCVATTSPDQSFVLIGTTGAGCGTPTPTGTATATATATPTGTPVAGCGENFDGVTAPALPAGWTTAETMAEAAVGTATTHHANVPEHA